MALKRKSKPNTTKLGVIQVATRMFLEKGYTDTSIRAISKELGISSGHVMFYFPTKEHLLAVLVEMLCNFQWQMLKVHVNEGKSSLMAICLELMSMAAICEESEIAKDFYISAYTHPITLEIIRKSDRQRAKNVFAQYCPDWDDMDFKEAETLVSGIEYATLMTTESSSSLDVRIAGALNGIMTIYNVPKDIRETKIEKVLSMDYYKIGQSILEEFKAYIEKANEHAFEDILKSNSEC